MFIHRISCIKLPAYSLIVLIFKIFLKIFKNSSHRVQGLLHPLDQGCVQPANQRVNNLTLRMRTKKLVRIRQVF